MKGGMRLALALIASALLIDLVLIQPNHPNALSWRALRLVPLELPVLLLGLLALGRRATWLALLAALALLLMVLVKLADFGVYTAFARGFDPLADMHLLPAGLNLLSGSIGLVGTLVLGLLLMLALAAMAWLLYRALRLWARTGSRLPASARLMAEIQPFQNYFAFIKVRDDKDKLAEKVAAFEKDVANFETFLEIHQVGDGPFLCGSDMCFGEAVMAPFVVRCGPNLKHFCGVDVMEIARKHPRVSRLITAILERPSVKETSLSDEKIVEGMTRMMKMFASK